MHLSSVVITQSGNTMKKQKYTMYVNRDADIDGQILKHLYCIEQNFKKYGKCG